MNKTKQIEEVFEVHGYYEELVIVDGGKFKTIGTRRIPKPVGRELGVYGRIDYVFTEPIELESGHKTIKIKASDKRPLVCFGHANAICGRLKSPPK